MIVEIVEKSAWLEICGVCGKHARIVLADGTKGYDLSTRDALCDEVRRLLREGRIDRAESQFLFDAIGSWESRSLNSLKEDSIVTIGIRPLVESRDCSAEETPLSPYIM